MAFDKELMSDLTIATPPAAFQPIPIGDGFSSSFGPLYGCPRNGVLVLGFRVLAQHVNHNGVCHGGPLASFADMQAFAAQFAANLRHNVTPTISLDVKYLASATQGQWIESETKLLKTTRRMLFTQSIVAADRVPILHCAGIYKIGIPAEGAVDMLSVFHG